MKNKEGDQTLNLTIIMELLRLNKMGDVKKQDLTPKHRHINPINSAGGKFSNYLPFLCVSPFNSALNNYCETARKTYWDQDVTFERFRESMAKPGELSPGEKFRAAVDELLKFAK